MIKYTKNISTKLLNMGFKFIEACSETINYDVYAFGPIDVVVDHTNKKVAVEFASWEMNVATLGQLQLLVNMLP